VLLWCQQRAWRWSCAAPRFGRKPRQCRRVLSSCDPPPSRRSRWRRRRRPDRAPRRRCRTSAIAHRHQRAVRAPRGCSHGKQQPGPHTPCPGRCRSRTTSVMRSSVTGMSALCSKESCPLRDARASSCSCAAPPEGRCWRLPRRHRARARYGDETTKAIVDGCELSAHIRAGRQRGVVRVARGKRE
jgi:hypothetical protein